MHAYCIRLYHLTCRLFKARLLDFEIPISEITTSKVLEFGISVIEHELQVQYTTAAHNALKSCSGSMQSSKLARCIFTAIEYVWLTSRIRCV